MKTTWVLRGFTLVELLIVISLFALVATFVISGFLNYAAHQNYLAAQTEVFSSTKETRQRSLSADGDTTHGIHFATSSITTFEGSSYNAGDLSNVIIPITSATISTSLTGGATDIIFARKTGAASATGTIAVIGLRNTGSSTITVSGTGLIQ